MCLEFNKYILFTYCLLLYSQPITLRLMKNKNRHKMVVLIKKKIQLVLKTNTLVQSYLVI